MEKHWLVCFAILLPACGDGGAATETEPTPIAAAPERVLAEIDLGSGRTLRVSETTPGEVSLFESGPLSAAPLLPTTPGDDLVALYDHLVARPDPGISRILADADARIRALAAATANDPAPVSMPAQGEPLAPPAGNVAAARQALSSSQGSIPTFTAAQFRSSFCNQDADGYDDGFCALDNTWADTGFSGDLSWIRSIVVPIASTSVTHQLEHYVCTTSILGLCVSQGWRTQSTQTIRPGQYGLYTDTFKWTRFVANGGAFNLGAIWNYK